MGELLSTKEVAAELGVSPSQLQRWLKADFNKPAEERRFPGAYRLGLGRTSPWQIPREDVEAFDLKRRGGHQDG